MGNFYREWAQFVTKKECRSAEQYNLSTAPDRHIRCVPAPIL
eukprot:COSAG01_NODE_990_length_12289_cov_22.606545_16_plen_42_part_00